MPRSVPVQSLKTSAEPLKPRLVQFTVVVEVLLPRLNRATLYFPLDSAGDAQTWLLPAVIRRPGFPDWSTALTAAFSRSANPTAPTVVRSSPMNIGALAMAQRVT